MSEKRLEQEEMQSQKEDQGIKKRQEEKTKTRSTTAAECVKDMGKAFLIGLLLAIAIGLILFVVGFAAKGGKLLSGLEAMKDGLFLIMAVLLFLLAGMLLTKGKKQREETSDREGWRRHFSVLGMKMVLALICIGFLLVATAADYVIWRIG